MHSSLSLLVSGQAQQIFFLGFELDSDATAADPWLTFCDPDMAKEERPSELPI